MITLITALVLSTVDPAPPAPHTALVVPLVEHAETPGTRIRLLDVVPLARRASLPDDLLQTDLGRAPTPGYSRRITRAWVRSALPDGVEIIGAAETLVDANLKTISSERILAEAEMHIQAHAGLAQGAILEPSRRPIDVRVPRGRKGVDLRPRLRGGNTGRGAIPVLVDVLVDGKLQATVSVSFIARVFADVPVLARAISRGGRLSLADLGTARVELTRSAIQPIDDVTALVGRIARRGLRAGQPLAERDFERQMLVRRNEPVTMVFARGTLRAETFGVAKESAGLGDPVRVENLTTKKIVVGRVLGPGLVGMNP